MSSLFAAQEAGQSPAASLLSVADGDGDGALTLDELSSALGVEGDDLSAGFTDIDANADGQVDASELDAGLRGMFERNGPPRGMMGADVASSLLSIADSDEGGSLSLSELLSALGETEEDGEVSSNFADYDTDGDQALNADELSAAFEAMISRMLSAYQSGTTDGDAALSVAV